MTVFERFTSYGFVHHRSLNHPSAFAATRRILDDHPGRTHVFEGDLCWDATGNQSVFYFRHPSFLVDTLGAETALKGLASGRLVGLPDLMTLREGGAFLVIELKVGRGDWRRALRELIDFLEQNFQDRYWIDGFSLTMLNEVKRINPATTVTLHTECVVHGNVVVGAPEWPPLRIMKPSELTGIDGVAIRRHGGERFMAQACSSIRSAGKALILSRLHSLRHFECSKAWGARAGYIHGDFDRLAALDDQLEGRPFPAGT